MAANSFQLGHAANTGSNPNNLTLNLSSNNPFRNRAASPASLHSAPPASPFDDPPPRPLSRNPFLDCPPLESPGVMSSQPGPKSLTAEEIFNSMTLDDKPRAPPPQPRRPMDRQPGPSRGENQPPSANSRHRPAPSQDATLRARRMPGGDGPASAGLQSPQRQPQQRPRRNSDSSLVDFDAQPLTEEEKKMIEASRRARREKAEAQSRENRPREARDNKERREGGEKRDREGRDGKDKAKSGSGSGSSRSTRPSRKMDIIDQLDATSIYGTGLFHHDGPFDALNPHRNRQSSRRAPMQAFPEGSLNNSLGGAGPLNARADHSTFMGMADEEAFRDYAVGKDTYKPKGEIFSATGRSDIVHGDESEGLGTSTFLEGTPAARSAIVRHQEEQVRENMDGGLQRKKSLAQRIRHINKGQREFSPSGRMTNPESAYGRRRSPDVIPSAGSNNSEGNPFFAEFGKGEESLSVRSRNGSMPTGSPPTGARRGSAGNVLERRATAEDEQGNKPTGLLGRMKSLKGGRRPRNDGYRDAPPPPGQAV